jgi:type I restriction enzyme S subunit
VGNKFAPEIRFAGFSGDWEQRRLGEVASNIGTGRSSFSIREKSDSAKYEVLGSTSVIGYDNSFDFEGDFILTARVGAYAGSLYQHSGKVKITDNTVFIQGENLSFIFYMMTVFDLKKLSFGTGQPLIKASELKKTWFKVPNKEEQTKIGDFFKQLDDTIALYQQELTTLKQTKQGFLQKMFPKEGESVPEVRFLGFTGEWEQRKLGDIYDVASGFAFKMSDYVQIGIPIINGESIQHGSISTKNLNFLPGGFLDKYKNFILDTDDIVLGLNRPITNGDLKIAQVPKDLDGALLYQRAGKIIVLKNSDINFSYQMLENEVSKFVLKEAVGSDQPFISTTKLKKWLIRVPTLKEEQTKIGLFFKNLNNTISLHQKELELLQETKKAFLQKMFI